MQTKNIECQLAQGQIGRYLNGERFSAQAIKQLEAHVADCNECSELVTRRRQALLTMLGERNSNLAVVSPRTESETAQDEASVNQRLMQAISKVSSTGNTAAAQGANDKAIPTPIVAQTKTKLFVQLMSSKPLLYCTALAAVLLAMSYFSRNALKTFGPTADQASILTPSEPVKPVSEVAKTTVPVNHKSVSASVAPISAGSTTPTVKPIANAPVAHVRATHAKVVARHITRQSHRVSAVHKPRAKVRHLSLPRHQVSRPRHLRTTHVRHIPTASAHSEIRIYDAQGRPIK